MSVIASSLFFASCGEDDEEDEPKQEQNTPNNNDNQNQNTKKPVGDPTGTVTVAKGESYQVTNSTIGIYNQDMVIEDVTESTITIKLSGSAIEDSKKNIRNTMCFSLIIV